MKELNFVVLFIVSFLLLTGCQTQKNIRSTLFRKEWNDSVTTLLNSKIRNKPEEHYIFKKLSETKRSYAVREGIDLQRRKIINKYGNEFLKSDTIIIVESYIELGSSYKFIVYTSSDKKIRKFYEETENSGFVNLKETDIKQNEEIDYVLTDKIEDFIKENRKYKMSPQTEYIISVFFRTNKDNYDFFSVQTTR